MPDIDSIRLPSRVGSNSSESRQTPSPTRASTSSHAVAATNNAIVQHEEYRRSIVNYERDRTSPQVGYGEPRPLSVYQQYLGTFS